MIANIRLLNSTHTHTILPCHFSAEKEETSLYPPASIDPITITITITIIIDTHWHYDQPSLLASAAPSIETSISSHHHLLERSHFELFKIITSHCPPPNSSCSLASALRFSQFSPLLLNHTRRIPVTASTVVISQSI